MPGTVSPPTPTVRPPKKYIGRNCTSRKLFTVISARHSSRPVNKTANFPRRLIYRFENRLKSRRRKLSSGARSRVALRSKDTHTPRPSINRPAVFNRLRDKLISLINSGRNGFPVWTFIFVIYLDWYRSRSRGLYKAAFLKKVLFRAERFFLPLPIDLYYVFPRTP